MGDQLDVLLHLCQIYLWFISIDAQFLDAKQQEPPSMSLRISKLAEIGIDPEMSPEMLDDYMADFTVPWDQWEVRIMLPQLCLREVTPQIMMEISLERFLNTPLQIGFLKSEVWSIQSLFVSIATVDARQHANSDILLRMECSSHMFTIYRSDLEACGDIPYMDGIPS